MIKVLLAPITAFWIGVFIAPLVTNTLYKYKMWKKKSRTENNAVEMSKEFESIHNSDKERGTPRPGGVMIWLPIVITAVLFWVLSAAIPNTSATLDFVSRNQTWLLFAVFLAGAGIGLMDDLMQVFKYKVAKFGTLDGFSGKEFLFIVGIYGLLGGYWFYHKLGVTSLHVPIVGDVFFGWLIIPMFLIVALATFSTGVIDGIDGLSGGVMASVFGAYGVIALMQGQLDIAAFCFALVASILVFLWFNIPPARFYMGETGMLALTFTLPVVAFLTDQVFVLPIIGAVLFATAGTSFIQIVSKKIFGPEKGKVFKVAPFHHHLQYIGWGNDKIVMRYWIISFVFAFMGVLLATL